MPIKRRKHLTSAATSAVFIRTFTIFGFCRRDENSCSYYTMLLITIGWEQGFGETTTNLASFSESSRTEDEEERERERWVSSESESKPAKLIRLFGEKNATHWDCSPSFTFKNHNNADFSHFTYNYYLLINIFTYNNILRQFYFWNLNITAHQLLSS